MAEELSNTRPQRKARPFKPATVEKYKRLLAQQGCKYLGQGDTHQKIFISLPCGHKKATHTTSLVQGANVAYCQECGETRDPAETTPPPDRADNMTLRDYFAAYALVGLIPSHNVNSMYFSPSSFADECYALADAMIEARK